jgi:hypothetical protein
VVGSREHDNYKLFKYIPATRWYLARERVENVKICSEFFLSVHRPVYQIQN